MNSFDLVCAILASSAYQVSRNAKNQTPPAPGAEELPGGYESDAASGFEATAYRFGGQIIIAFSGTDPSDGNDIAADAMLGAGLMNAQLQKAALFYEKIKTEYGSNITFTGHSLGGGLAALMGVFFNKPAVTFDPAPFRLSATQSNAQALQRYIGAVGTNHPAYNDADLNSFTTTDEISLALAMPEFAASLAAIAAGVAVAGFGFITAPLAAWLLSRSYPKSIRGELNVKPYAVAGEFLTNGYQGLGAGVENDLRIKSGTQPTLIDINPSDVSGGDLHSMSLLVVAAVAPGLIDEFKKMPSVVAELFDKQLYSRDGKDADTDFLNGLLRAEYGTGTSTGIISRFGADVQRMDVSDGMAAQPALQKALFLAVMEYYRKVDASNTNAFVRVEGNAVHMDLSEAMSKSPQQLAQGLRSYLLPEEWEGIGYRLGGQSAWHIQSGDGAVSWTASGNVSDLAIGGAQADSLDGGAGDDILIGGPGNDLLNGGAGADILIAGFGDDSLDGGPGSDYLYGGSGTDKYDLHSGELADIIIDSDGNGSIWVDGVQLTGGEKSSESYWVSDDHVWGFELMSNGDLVILHDSSTDRLIIRDWNAHADKLGITLSDQEVQPAPPDNTFIGDYAKKITPDGAGYVFEDGRYVADGASVDAADVMDGSAQNDFMRGLGGNDAIAGLEGADYIDGGPGDDLLLGGSGADTLNGGAGNDILLGSAGASSKLPFWQPASTEFTPIPSDGEDFSRGFSWVATRPAGEVNFQVAGAFVYPLAESEGNNIDGGDGNDIIGAGRGNDIAHGGLGNDTVRGMGGSDILFGDDGNDLVVGDGFEGIIHWTTLPEEHGSDVIDGGAGNDTLGGQGGDDKIYGGDGNDLILGDDEDFVTTPVAIHGSDYLDGEAGDDTIIGFARDDTIFGGDGNDKIDGDWSKLPGENHGADYLDGEAGLDTIIGGGGDDTIYGGDGNDQLGGDAGDVPSTDESFIAADYNGDDYVDGEGGDDQIVGDGGDDELFGGAGNDILNGDGFQLPAAAQGDDYIDGEDGNDTVNGNAGNDELFGGSGNDVIRGDDFQLAGADHGNDYLDGEQGDDTLIGNGGDDELFGGDGNDVMSGDDASVALQFHGKDYLDGQDGNDRMTGGGNDDTLWGGAGNDLIHGDADEIAGSGHGNDQLYGEEGNDTIIGGGGSDTIGGGAGDDLIFGDGAVAAQYHGADLLFGGEGDDQIQGGSGNDTISGDAGNDLLVGDAGDDSMDGGEGVDELQGGAGNDVMRAGEGDKLFGQDGNDTLTGADGINAYLDGGDGDDWLEGGSTMVGGEGNDTIVGSGAFAIGGAGNDTYVVKATSGYTWIADSQGASTVKLAGVSAQLADMSLDALDTGSGPSFDVMRLTAGALQIDLSGLTTGGIAGLEVGGRSYEGGEFFGQVYAGSLSQSASAAGAILQGAKADDVLTSTGGGATLAGGGGNDTLTGSGGGNTYKYFLGDGTDTITDSGGGTLVLGAGLNPQDVKLSTDAGALVLSFGSAVPGSVRITGFDASNAGAATGIASFKFADGTVLTHAQLIARGFDITGTAGSDVLQGTNLADRLTGGAGADVLSGKGGADEYTFNLGDGVDVIADGDTAAGTGDVLRFGAGIATSNIFGLRSGNDVTLQVGGTDDQVTLKGYFGAGADAVERIVFSDGTEWTQADVLAAVARGGQIGWTLVGTSGDDSLTGAGGNDTLQGLAGSDTLTGGAGDDLLDGGVDGAADSLLGGAGSDVYLVRFNDVVNEINGDADSTDVLRFVGIKSTDVKFTVPLDGATLLVTEVSGGSNVTVRSQFTTLGTVRGIERFEFSDGVTLTAQQVWDRVNTGGPGRDELYATVLDDGITGGWGADFVHANSGNDTIHGNQGNDEVYGETGDDVIYGEEGEDTLFGGAGNDTLEGGAGWDRLDGGAGNDTYRLAPGAGMEIVVADASGTDRVLLAPGITSSNVTLYRVSSPPAENIAFNGDSLVIQLNGSGDQMWIANYFAAATQGYVETVQFADGTTWDYNTIVSKLASTGGTINTQTGTTKANTFTVDHWNDVVNDPSSTDADTVSASASYTMPVNVSTMTLTGSLNLFGTSATGGTINGNAGDNWFQITPGVGGYTFAGGAGNDVYVLWLDTEFVSPAYDPASALASASIVEAANGGTDTLVSGFWSSTLPDNVENMVLAKPNGFATAGQFAVSASTDYTHRYIGNASNNVIDASQYEDWAMYQNWMSRVSTYPTLVQFQLDGGAGADTMIGGRWHDTYYVDNAGDVVIETGYDQGGNDISTDTIIVNAATGFLTRLADHVENLRIDSTVAGADGEGNGGANVMTGGAGANKLSGLGGNDTLYDHAVGVAATDNDTLEGGDGNDALNSYAGVDVLDGGAGDDVLHAYGGGRTLTLRLGFGDGHDTLVQDAGSTATVTLEFKTGVGPSDVQLSKSSGVLRVSLGDGSSIDLYAGNTLTLRFSDGTTLGPAQVDAMLRTSDRTTPTEQDDLLFGTASAESISALGGQDLVYAGDGADTIDGGAGNDTLLGGGLADVLTGGAGNDVLAGGAGTDVYRFSRGFGSDTVDDTWVGPASNAADDGASDSVEFDATIPVTDIVAYRQVVGSTVTGIVLTVSGTADSVLLAHAYASGAAGQIETVRFADGTQWDLATLKAKVAGDVGTDTANDALTASVVNARLQGLGGNDTLTGGTGSDSLDGGTGDDSMSGGTGNDTYWVDSLADVVVEAVGGGTDTVIASVDNYTLPTEVEKLELAAGTMPLGGTGNALANTLTGNAGNNRLNGGAGNDTMIGGAGNDTYVVDTTADVITEAANGGVDSIETTISYSLANLPNVENLYLMGTGKITGTGNALDNLLVGNTGINTLTGGAGNDTLDGGGGADKLSGGAGDDLYIINLTTDTVDETSTGSSGNDTVNVSLAAAGTYTLPTNVENAFIGNGTAGVNLTGNTLANLLTGNGANNTLNGAAGADTLIGGAGNDTLTGGADADRFVFNLAPGAGNVDTITDFQTGVDTIALSVSTFSALGTVGARIGLSDKLIYTASTGVLAYDADGAGGAAAVNVAVLGTSTHPASLGNDFVLF